MPKSKKILSIVAALAIFVQILSVPKTAEAIPVIDGSALAQRIGVWIATQTTNIARWIKEDMAKAARDILAKKIIDYTVQETAKWIENGGKPQYVQNWKQAAQESVDLAIEDLIYEVGLSDLCSPFSFQLNVAAIPTKKFYQNRAKCTLDDIVKNIEDFYADFQNGGWLAYSSAWKAENNFYVQFAAIDDLYIDKLSVESDAKKSEATSGQGWLSQKKCLADNSQEIFDQCMANAKETAAMSEFGYDGGGDSYDICMEMAAQKSKCTKEEIITPGDAIGKSVGAAITSDSQWAANIQSWMAVLVNAAINRVTKEGILALTGASSKPNTDSYQPPEYEDMVNEELAGQNRDLYKNIKLAADEFTYRVSKKTDTVVAVMQIKSAFETIQRRNCVPIPTAAEIQDLQVTIDNLNKEINYYNTGLSRARTVMEMFNRPNMTIREQGLARQAAEEFEKQYDSNRLVVEAMSGAEPGTPHGNIESALSSFQDQANNARIRLNVCTGSNNTSAN